MLLQGNLSNPTPPYASANYSALAFPAPVAYPFYSASNDGICNTYLPNDSTLNRRAALTLLWSCCSVILCKVLKERCCRCLCIGKRMYVSC